MAHRQENIPDAISIRSWSPDRTICAPTICLKSLGNISSFLFDQLLHVAADPCHLGRIGVGTVPSILDHVVIEVGLPLFGRIAGDVRTHCTQR